MDNKDEQGHVFVLGAARVGKSKFIETVVYLSRGETIILSSPQLQPHTSDFSFHEAFGMHWCNMPGFLGDEGHNDVILHAIEAAHRAPIHPPLIILRTLNQAELLWTEGLVNMFSSVVIAVRCDDFSDVPQQVARFHPLQVFHIPEFIPRFVETITDYEQSIQLIVDFYHTLEPRRQNINFDHRLFSGEVVEQGVGVEERIFKRQEVQREKISWEVVRKYLGKRGYQSPQDKKIIEFCLSNMLRSGCTKFVKLIPWDFGNHVPTNSRTAQSQEGDAAPVRVTTQTTAADLITTTTYHDHKRRTKVDKYKRLASGPLIFVERFVTDWDLVQSDQIAIDVRTTDIHNDTEWDDLYHERVISLNEEMN